MSEQKDTRKTCTRLKIAAITLAALSAALLVGSFFTPPMWKIDGSVIAGTGVLFAYAALFFAWEAVDRGMDAKITHGNSSLELNNPDK